MPAYLLELEPKASVEKNVRDHVLRRGSFLFRAVDFLVDGIRVYPFRSDLELDNREPSLAQFRKSFFRRVSQAYEDASREKLRSSSATLPFPLRRIGRWWRRAEEVDVVGTNEDLDAILFAEVKWSNKPLGSDIYRRLQDKSRSVEWGSSNRREAYALFSKSGFTAEMKRIAKEDRALLVGFVPRGTATPELSEASWTAFSPSPSRCFGTQPFTNRLARLLRVARSSLGTPSRAPRDSNGDVTPAAPARSRNAGARLSLLTRQDNFCLERGVRLMEVFLERTKESGRGPCFAGTLDYGDGHDQCYSGVPSVRTRIARLTIYQRHLPVMIEHMLTTAPEGADVTSWRY